MLVQDLMTIKLPTLESIGNINNILCCYLEQKSTVLAPLTEAQSG